MPDWLKALIAGYGAKKLGGGCFSTIIVFVVIYYALGQCNRPAVRHTSIKAEKNQWLTEMPATITLAGLTSSQEPTR